ncbi:MAG: dihydrofolate reductase [Legionellales bacterium RIFCSPHIGHO2_12_FULL_37_14]|nr:MAG: dihydrofolate reductase [Legionellales bacterium RIFCSPHIGHO2_12_FULL_37_14]
MSNISLIVVVDEAFAIGKDKQLLCHLPKDLQHFKSLTLGKPILMGRKTFESIGKPLPNRQNIVLTHKNLQIQGVEIATSLDAALNMLKDAPEIMIIGGAKVYAKTLDLAEKIYLTQIHHTFKDADTFFPPLTADSWIKEELGKHKQDAKNAYAMTFYCYRRK